MFCHNCGASNPDGYQFCEKCGTKLVSAGGATGNGGYGGGYTGQNGFENREDYGGYQYQNSQQGYANNGYAGNMENRQGNYRQPYSQQRQPNPPQSGYQMKATGSAEDEKNLFIGWAFISLAFLVGSLFMTCIENSKTGATARLYDDMAGKLILLGAIPVLICIVLDLRAAAIVAGLLGMIDLFYLENAVEKTLGELETSDVNWKSGLFVAWIALLSLFVSGIWGMNKKRQRG